MLSKGRLADELQMEWYALRFGRPRPARVTAYQVSIWARPQHTPETAELAGSEECRGMSKQ